MNPYIKIYNHLSTKTSYQKIGNVFHYKSKQINGQQFLAPKMQVIQKSLEKKNFIL